MGFLFDFVTLPSVQALGWALFHFIWQGAILALLLAGLLALPALRPPQIRYTLCLVGLMVMVVAPLVTGWVVYEPARAGVAIVQNPSLSALEDKERAVFTPEKGQGPGVVAIAPLRAFTPQVAPRSQSRNALLRWKV